MGIDNPNTAINGPPSARQRNAIEIDVDAGPTLNAGLVALRFLRGSGPVVLRNPIFL